MTPADVLELPHKADEVPERAGSVQPYRTGQVRKCQVRIG